MGQSAKEADIGMCSMQATPAQHGEDRVTMLLILQWYPPAKGPKHKLKHPSMTASLVLHAWLKDHFS
jgi:hypothetical protein